MLKFARISSEQNMKKPEELPPIPIKSFEAVLKELGCFGPFQALTLFSYLFLEVAAAFVAFIPICVARRSSPGQENCTNPYDNFTTATTPPGITQTLFDEDDGSNYSTTKSWIISQTPEISTRSLVDDFKAVFEEPFKYESLVDEWDLKCSRSWIPDIFTSLLMAGMIVGNLIWSGVADWYGRRPAYLCILCILFSGTVLSMISPNPYFYALSRFIAGSGYSGFINVSTMSVMEFMTPKWRSLANMIGPIGEGIMLLSLLGYFIRPWRKLYLATLTPYLLIIPIYFLLPESPRWLLRNRKIKEAHQVLGYMAKINGRAPIPISVLEELAQKEAESSQDQKAKKISYLQFIRTKELMRPAIFLFAMWFSWNVGYYGISYNIRNVPGNPYINLALIGLANAIGQRCSMPVSERYGRRRAVLYGMTLAAAFLVTLAICFLTMKHVSSGFILIASVVGLLGLSVTRASLRLLSGESFPTSVRTMGLGMGGLGANTAGLLTPQTAYLGSKSQALPFFIFAVVAVLGSLVVLMMKETSGNPLSDNVKDKEQQRKQSTVSIKP